MGLFIAISILKDMLLSTDKPTNFPKLPKKTINAPPADIKTKEEQYKLPFDDNNLPHICPESQRKKVEAQRRAARITKERRYFEFISEIERIHTTNNKQNN